MSHGLVTYLVPALRISTPPAIPGIRKLLARNSIGVHSNSRIPTPSPSLPLQLPLLVLHARACTPMRCARARRTSGKISTRVRNHLSRADFPPILRRFYNDFLPILTPSHFPIHPFSYSYFEPHVLVILASQAATYEKERKVIKQGILLYRRISV